MFGLFENKQGKALVAETLRTIEHADLLSTKDKNKVAKNVFTKIIKAINEIDGVPHGPKLDKIMQRQIQDATKQRQKQITADEERNPKWIETALFESFLLMNCGKFGEKISKQSIIVGGWCRENMTQAELNKFEKKLPK